MQQTTVQNSNTIRFGSGKVEVGEDEGSLVNLGAMDGVTFEESWDEIEVESDNAGRLKLGIENHVAAISGDVYEINLESLSTLRGGLDTLETVSGATGETTTQEVDSGDWGFNEFIKLEEQNNVSVTDVTGDSTSYVEDDDYYVVEDEHGNKGIVVVDTTDTDESHDLDIDLEYDVTAAKQLLSGGKTTIEPRVVRITNTDEDGNKFQITIYKAYNTEGITIELQSDDAGEPATTPITLEGTLDDERDSGEQLFKIYDEQGVA